MAPKTRGSKRKAGNAASRQTKQRCGGLESRLEPAIEQPRNRNPEMPPQENETEEIQPIPPEKLFFSSTDYVFTCKLASKCNEVSTLKLLESKLPPAKMKWFYDHPQFKHVFHMPKEKFHKLTHLWLLLLRTVDTKMEKMAWFIVNGVPIRYSIREHALLSGFNCKAYPDNHRDTLGSIDFPMRHFGTDGKHPQNKILVSDVMNKFKSMRPNHPDKLKMGVLLFLSTVIRKSNTAGAIDDFFFRVVDDLDACITYPWGRDTFDDQLKEVWHAMDHMKGNVQGTWTFPGFLLPLSILACEALPVMQEAFMESYDCDETLDTSECGRMCKRKWKHCSMKGWPLLNVNNVLGETKEVYSILEPTDSEVLLLDKIMDEEDVYEGEDYMSVNWNTCILQAKKKIFFEDLFESDVGGRNDNLNGRRKLSLKETLMQAVDNVAAVLGQKIDDVSAVFCEKLDKMDKKVNNVETTVTHLVEWHNQVNSDNTYHAYKDDQNGVGGGGADVMDSPPRAEENDAEEEKDSESVDNLSRTEERVGEKEDSESVDNLSRTEERDEGKEDSESENVGGSGDDNGGNAMNFMENPHTADFGEVRDEEERAEEIEEEEIREEEILALPPIVSAARIVSDEEYMAALGKLPKPQVTEAKDQGTKDKGKGKEKAKKVKEPKKKGKEPKTKKVRPKVKKDTEDRSRREPKASRFDRSPWLKK